MRCGMGAEPSGCHNWCRAVQTRVISRGPDLPAWPVRPPRGCTVIAKMARIADTQDPTMMTKKTSASTSVAAAGSAAGSSAAGPSAAAGATSKAAETAARASHSECEPPVGGAVSAHRGADTEVAPSPRNPGKRPRTDPPSPDIATPVAASDPPKQRAQTGAVQVPASSERHPDREPHPGARS